jgi:hypothetical protein
MHRHVVIPVLFLTVLLASCSRTTPPLVPSLVDTTSDVYEILVAGTAGGPLLHQIVYGDFTADVIAALPTGTNPVLWFLSCEYGIEEAEFGEADLFDAWDGSELYLGAWLAFGTGTLREYDDGTLVLSCAPTPAVSGVTVARHLIVPGAGTGGRFVVEVVDLVGTSGTTDLADFYYSVNDGADDSFVNPWHDFGSIAPFAWATKDSYDLGDPAIGLLPMPSARIAVDVAFTRGQEYALSGAAGATLAVGQRAALAMVAGARSFTIDNLASKNAAMAALGLELAAYGGPALCDSTPSAFHVWTALVPNGAAIASSICANYE